MHLHIQTLIEKYESITRWNCRQSSLVQYPQKKERKNPTKSEIFYWIKFYYVDHFDEKDWMT